MSWACCSTLLLLLTLNGCSGSNEYQPPPPPTVVVARPLQQTVTEYLEEVGQTEATQRTEVRARVQGVLQEMRFTPGQEVKAGNILYVIERDEYVAARNAAKAALESAQANLAAATAAIAVAEAQAKQVEATVARAQSEFRRQEQLLAEDATSETIWEQAKTDLDSAIAEQQGLVARLQAANANEQQAQAEVLRAEAQLEQAQLNLDYTEVKAEIDGRITATEVKVGNLVEAGTTLTTIVRTSEIWANFNLAEEFVLRLRRAEDSEESTRDLREVEVGLKRAIDDSYVFRGNLDYYDQEGIDQATGTLFVRALFDNANQKLLPGLFVRVRVPIGKFESALLVPESALGRDPAGSYLLVLDDAGKVARRVVEPGPKYGEMIMIRSGLNADDQVIVEGLQRARPGAEVTVETTPLELPAEFGSSARTASAETASEDEPRDAGPAGAEPPQDN